MEQSPRLSSSPSELLDAYYDLLAVEEDFTSLTMMQTPRLLGLSRELRDIIYDILAEEEDFTSLTQTCRQLRKEIFSRMPWGRVVYYKQAYDNATLKQRLRSSIEISHLSIHVEPRYIPGAVLNLEVTWRATRSIASRTWKTSRWAIRDLSSPMARYAYLLDVADIRIVFEAAVYGHLMVAFLILRAKIFEVYEFVSKFFPLRLDVEKPFVEVAFCGGLDLDRPQSVRKSFWEMRPRRPGNPERFPCFRCRETGKTVCTIKSHQRREHYPFFYECLLIPLTRYWNWKPNYIRFDYQPPKKRCSYFRRTRRGPYYFGVNALCRQVTRPPPGRRFDDTFFARERWQPFAGWERDQIDGRLRNFALDTPYLLASLRSPEANQLRAYILERRDAHPRSPFALAWKAFVRTHLLERMDPEKYHLEAECIMAAYIGWASGFAPTV